jgi:hypothetical protein
MRQAAAEAPIEGANGPVQAWAFVSEFRRLCDLAERATAQPAGTFAALPKKELQVAAEQWYSKAALLGEENARLKAELQKGVDLVAESLAQDEQMMAAIRQLEAERDQARANLDLLARADKTGQLSELLAALAQARADLAAAQALVGELAAFIRLVPGSVSDDQCQYCPFCDASDVDYDAALGHADDCAWVKARALAQQQEGE